MIFQNQTSDYAHGVEFGGYLYQMKCGFELPKALCHRANLEQLREAAKLYGYEFGSEMIDDVWAYFTIKKATPHERT